MGMRETEQSNQTSPEFRLGKPALVCRWRLQNRTLPLANRHLRALGAREANGARVTPELVAWAKQHIEWTLTDGAAEHPDGVLMIIVDEAGQAAMTIGDYDALSETDLHALMQRARSAAVEAERSGVAPETLWLVSKGTLMWDQVGHDPSGSATLIRDLAKTLGMPMERTPDLLRQLREDHVSFDEAFLVSDEHGVIPASDHSGSVSERFAAGYARLLASTRS